MTLTVLFDLDDTLLDTNMDVFLPAYFDALGAAFTGLGSPRTIARQIGIAVQHMETNDDPGVRLEDIFSAHFYPPLGATQADCQQELAHFYRHDFPRLRKHTHPKPATQKLIAWCQAQGFPMAIATNPLFPKTASRQRAQWAGLDPEAFVFVSTYDDFHFTKPNLPYYAECLGRMGWPDHPAVMIGDNFTHDIQPMTEMGFRAFWVNPEDPADDQDRGTLQAVQPWIETIHRDHPSALANTPKINLAILRSTPAVLDSWQRKAPVPLLTRPTADDGVSIADIFRRLAEFETEVALPFWEQRRSPPDIPAHNPDPYQWNDGKRPQHQDPLEEFSKFLTARRESLAALQKSGAFGDPAQASAPESQSLTQTLANCAENDRFHLRQCRHILDFYNIY